MSLLSSLYTGSSGLFVNQKGIEVSGNNVSNVNTPAIHAKHFDSALRRPLNSRGR